MAMFDMIVTSCKVAFGMQIKPVIDMVSGALFFIVAWKLWHDYLQTSKKRDEERITLLLLIVLIGTGSMMLHVSHVQFGELVVNLGIGLFYPFFIYVCLRRLVGVKLFPALAMVAAFGALHSLTFLIPRSVPFVDSLVYATFPPSLLIIAFFLAKKHHEATRTFLYSAILLFVAAVSHAADKYVCSLLPTGSIFIWQICIASGFYLLCTCIKERRHELRKK